MKLLQRRRRIATRPPRATRAPDAASPELAEQNRARVAQALGAPVQARLKLGAPDDAHEHEADRFADGVLQRQCADCARQGDDETLQRQAEAGSGGGEVAAGTAAAIQGRRGGGAPLPAAERGFFEPRLQTPLAPVRLHTDPASAQLADALGARAFTVGHDVFFASGEYRPASADGRHLLAHELAHVRQQAGGTLQRQPREVPAKQPPAKEPAPAVEPEAPKTLPAIDRATLDRRLADGIALLGGRHVAQDTLGAELQPVLRDLAAAAAWRDEKGRERGGRVLRRQVGGATLSLRMVLDDSATPGFDAEFISRGADEGTFRVFVRRMDTPETVAGSLYHESLHMVGWIAQRRGGPHFQSRAAPEVLKALDMGQRGAAIETTRRWLARLVEGVNQRRAAGDTISAERTADGARMLVEEALVRAETAAFSEAMFADMPAGGHSTVGGDMNGVPLEFAIADLEAYLFGRGNLFRRTDGGAALTPEDRQAIRQLAMILGRLIVTLARRRFRPHALAPVKLERPPSSLEPTLPGGRSFPLPDL